VIDKGTHSQYRAYIFEDDFGHDWMHVECADAMRLLDAEVGETYQWNPGDFRRGSCEEM
jgi:hypothetical protein